ncbi:DUF456 domain-containing protein [Tenacibaculum sp. C7A-26P2]|uniref:DUF456 domain-containing protein n=1 Tax=Tenacibaculum sp. C7A-26P2 TaxID=3447504 RepID=UPI003F8489CD
MDLFLLTIAFIFSCLGIIGSFLPILPGPLTGWFGLWILHITEAVPMNVIFLLTTFIIALIIFVLDYFIPAIGTKKFGGTKFGIYGTTIGLIIGMIIPVPFGIIIGALLGAFIGELIYNQNIKRVLKASFGAFVGFIVSITLKFIVAFTYFTIFLIKLWEHREGLF